MVFIREFLGPEVVLSASAERQTLYAPDGRSNQTEGVLVYNMGGAPALFYWSLEATMPFWEVQPGQTTIIPVGRSVGLYVSMTSGQIVARDVALQVVS